jgi:hypothetical protein
MGAAGFGLRRAGHAGLLGAGADRPRQPGRVVGRNRRDSAAHRADHASRTILGGTPGPQQAIEATQPIVERQYSKAGGPVTLASLETKGDRIHLVFKVGPAGTATAVYDSRTGKVVALAGPP